jgi:hypothetical protein
MRNEVTIRPSDLKSVSGGCKNCSRRGKQSQGKGGGGAGSASAPAPSQGAEE